MTTMQERAAKVAEDYADYWTEAKTRLRPVDEVPDAHDRFFNYIENAKTVASRIRALSPDPTRAALEECVRAMEPLAALYERREELCWPGRLYEGDEGMPLEDGDGAECCIYIEDMRRAFEALATARNALEGK